MNKQIDWSEALQLEKDQKIQENIDKIKYQENLSLATAEVWEVLGCECFSSSDVADIAMNYGVDEDDLIFNLI